MEDEYINPYLLIAAGSVSLFILLPIIMFYLLQISLTILIICLTIFLVQRFSDQDIIFEDYLKMLIIGMIALAIAGYFLEPHIEEMIMQSDYLFELKKSLNL